MNPYDFDPNDDAGNGIRERSGGNRWLDVGRHVVTIESHELGEAGTGTPYIEFVFVSPSGGEHKERFTLHENARWKLAKIFKAVEFTAKINLSQNGMVKRALYGKPMEIVIELGKPNASGKQYREIRYVNPAPAGTRRPTVSGLSPGRIQGDPPGDDAPPPADDDIPF